jgi:hypothetical protein
MEQHNVESNYQNDSQVKPWKALLDISARAAWQNTDDMEQHNVESNYQNDSQVKPWKALLEISARAAWQV